MKRVKMPLADYVNDLKSVLDQALRILNAIVDVAADAGLLSVVLLAMETTQLIVQGRLPEDSPLLQVPHVNSEFTVKKFNAEGIWTLPHIVNVQPSQLRRIFSNHRRGAESAVMKDLAQCSQSVCCVRARSASVCFNYVTQITRISTHSYRKEFTRKSTLERRYPSWT
jgi:preprotein translocase subunit Sec63